MNKGTMQSHSNTVFINQKKFKVLIRESEIEQLVSNIAERINEDYRGKKPLFLIVLKGSMFFASDLLRKIELECEIDTVSAKSYGNYMKSTGEVNLMISKLDVTGKDIIIIEDIVDTGYTLNKLIDKLKFLNPASIEVAALLSKPAMRKINIDLKYLGLEIPPFFVIGYGLDFGESGRNLPAIYSHEEE